MVAKPFSGWHINCMSQTAKNELHIHLAADEATGRWYVADSELPGLRLEAADPARLIRRIIAAAPELLVLNAKEIEARFGMSPGEAVKLTPVFDSPLPLAA